MASTAELEAEILADLEENPDAYTAPVNDVITIDPETKTINLPSSEVLFGTEEEHGVERKYFKCPRIVGDNIDLFTHQIYISYMAVKDKNAAFIPDSIPQSYWCDDVALDETGNYITFSWLLSGNVLASRGFVGFAVIAKSVEGDILKTRWKTAPAVGTVLMTLPDAGEGIAELYPDIITQLLDRMDAVEEITSVELDESLSDNTKAAPAGMVGELKVDLSKLSEEIGQLKQNGTGTGTGLSTEAIDKLEEVGNYLAYTTADGGSKWTELISILRNGSSGGGSGETVPATGISLDKTTLSFTDSATQTLVATVEPSDTTDKVVWTSNAESVATVTNGVVKPLSNGSAIITATCGSVSATCSVTVDIAEEEQVTLTSISATYTGGDVAVGTSLNDLTGITVTAHYSDGSTANVTDYTLSGTIADGTNTITVSYGGKTTTFTVVGVTESSGEEVETNGWTNGRAYEIEWIDGYRFRDSDLGEPQAYATNSITPFMPCQNANRLNIVGTVYGSIFWYDAEQNYLRYTKSSAVIENTPIPTDAYYFRLCVVSENTSAFVATPYRDELLTETTAWESDKFYRMEFTVGQSINSTSGVVSTDVNRTVSSVGYCYGASTIQIYPYGGNIRVAFYDVDGEYLGSFGTFDTSTGVATVPETAKTFRYHDYSKVTGYNAWVKLN